MEIESNAMKWFAASYKGTFDKHLEIGLYTMQDPTFNNLAINIIL